MNSEQLGKIIQRHLNGEQASYSITKEGVLTGWESKKAEPIEEQIEELRQILELEEAERKAKDDKRDKIVEELGAEDITEALTKQINELREAIISGDNTEVEKTKGVIDNIK